MKYDCGFAKGGSWFRYRTGGIVIHDGRMLFVRSAIGDYYYMIGGGVHVGETSAECIEREILEETGIEAKVVRLAVVCENFFKGIGGAIDGYDCHTIEFYYRMDITGDVSRCRAATDNGEALVWLSAEEIRTSKIKPDFIREHINEIVGGKGIIHIIEESDR